MSETQKLAIIIICAIGGFALFIGGIYGYCWYRKKYGKGSK